MANISHTASAAGLSGLSLRTLFARVADWNDARRTRAILSQLTTHELDDIGLVRGDIEKIAKQHL